MRLPAHRTFRWSRRPWSRCGQDAAVMLCGRFARHDSLGEKPLVGWPLLSCSGSLNDAPVGHGAEQTVLFGGPEPAALVQPALFG